MAELSAIQLDWRVAPDVETMLFKLYTLFVNAGDTTSAKVNTQLSDSRAKGAQQLVSVDENGKPDENGDRTMFVRYEKTFRRGWTSKRDKTYWAKWFLVLQDTVVRLSNFTSESQRLTGYMVMRHNFQQQEARKILLDIALTIGVHPSALGSTAAAGGLIIAPRKLGLKLVVVADILQWLTLRDVPDPGNALKLTETLRVDNSWVDLPPLVLEMQTKRKKIDAVVVAEHRNIECLLSSYRIVNRGLDRVYFVLVSHLMSCSD